MGRENELVNSDEHFEGLVAALMGAVGELNLLPYGEIKTPITISLALS